MDSNILNNQSKGRLVLKPEIVDKIKKEGILFGQVCEAVGVVPTSLFRLLLRNHWKLTTPQPLQVIKDYMKAKDTADLVVMQEVDC